MLALPALAAACSAAPPADPTASSSEAFSESRILHTNVTKHSWVHARGHGGGRDDGRSCRPAPLDLCPYLDEQFIGVDGGAACAHVTTDSCPDRIDTCDFSIVIDFAMAITNDCRFGQWAPPLLTSSDVADYLNDLTAFTLAFYGCPVEGTTGPLTFGLIPAALAGDTVTTADLAALSDLYVGALQQSLSDNGSHPLTPEQVAQIRGKLARLARHVPNTKHSRTFTFSTCADDAGTPAPAPDDDDLHGCDFGR